MRTVAILPQCRYRAATPLICDVEMFSVGRDYSHTAGEEEKRESFGKGAGSGRFSPRVPQ